MIIQTTSIDGLKVGKLTSNKDSRGSFSRFFCEKELHDIINTRRIVQINHSQTEKVGSLRGLHFQHPPHSELKIVRCLKGRVWDVAVDLRANSTTFLQWHAEELSPSSSNMMIIPEGFAHGFQVLEPNSELLYLHTAFYNPTFEGGIKYDDPLMNISWPLKPIDLSVRDMNHPYLDANYKGIIL